MWTRRSSSVGVEVVALPSVVIVKEVFRRPTVEVGANLVASLDDEGGVPILARLVAPARCVGVSGDEVLGASFKEVQGGARVLLGQETLDEALLGGPA